MSDDDFDSEMEDYSEPEFYSDEDDGFLDDRATESELHDKNYAPHKSHTTSQLTARMAGQAKDVSEVLGLSQDDTITLLHHYNWNSEKLMDVYMENPQKTRDDAGLVKKSGKHKSGKRHYSSASEFTCMICCEDEQDSYQLSCGHEYCIGCYKRYIEERVQKGEIIRCPSCDVSLDRSDVDAICGNGVSNELLESSIRTYVERHQTYKWCPAPDCEIVIEVLDPMAVSNIVSNHGVPVATCTHGHQFCLSCALENHSPAPCHAAAAWIKKCKDDSETVKWISTNTKKCQKCNTSIEKNGGCNHMTCKKCGHEFCWICNGTWRAHGTAYFQCNRFKEDKNVKKGELSKNATKASLDRYLHFYNMYNEHDKSTRQDAKRCAEVEESVRILQETSGISWIEAQFLSQAATMLLRTRRILKWSYAFAFYCDQNNYYNIFSDVQARHVLTVEALSKLFEVEDPLQIVEHKLDFLNKSQQALDSQKALSSCAEDCTANGTMSTDMGD